MKYRVKRDVFVEGEDLLKGLTNKQIMSALKITTVMSYYLRTGKFVPTERQYLKYKNKITKYLTGIK